MAWWDTKALPGLFRPRTTQDFETCACTPSGVHNTAWQQWPDPLPRGARDCQASRSSSSSCTPSSRALGSSRP